jgi:hypothetical protein
VPKSTVGSELLGLAEYELWAKFWGDIAEFLARA